MSTYQKALKQALADKPGARDDLARILADELASEMNIRLLARPSYTYGETNAAAAWPVLLPTPEPPGFYRLVVNVEILGYDPKLSPPYAILERGAIDNPEFLAVFQKIKGRWYTVEVWPRRITERERLLFPDVSRAVNKFDSQK